ncbi:S1/P1 nuclease [Paludibaculum fermentans]|uniref:S1/P1 nuclease n=1 Tax=Paludibaculum fermentans TaxID=1473598 RepID=A0A7S7NQT5_PALFE|nr:S1/P1 nuclease [Paludibaculum fermentans]QOY88077.1 S1/P1 nuclease [Paludibaculum fermentans]
MSRFRVSCLGLLLVSAPALFGWGREGHRLIAEIASRQLNAKARAEVQKLLDGQSLESIASWADEVRPQRRETSTWHFIDLPLDIPRGDWKKFCPQTGCVVGQIPEMESRLRNKNLAQRDRAEALKFLVHLVSDMHQPLHVGEKHDRGGNDVKVLYFGKPSNLHSTWDSSILEMAEQKDANLKAALGRKPGFFERRRLAKGSLVDWAWQSRDVSRDVVYANLPEARPAPLGDEYFNKALPPTELQLRRAGVRLARILNEALGQ